MIKSNSLDNVDQSVLAMVLVAGYKGFIFVLFLCVPVSIRACPATAAPTAATCAALHCAMTSWSFSTLHCLIPKTRKSTWSRAGGRSWRPSAPSAALPCARCSATPPSQTATRQGWDQHPSPSAGGALCIINDSFE